MDFLELGHQMQKYKVNDVYVCPDFYHECNIVDFSKLKKK